MTPKKAISILRSSLPCFIGFEIYDATVLGIKALEKQDPKKAVTSDDGHFYRCPSCNNEIKSGISLCRNCGQVLKWRNK